MMNNKSLFGNLVLFVLLSSLVHAADIQNYGFWEIPSDYSNKIAVIRNASICEDVTFSLQNVDKQGQTCVENLRFERTKQVYVNNVLTFEKILHSTNGSVEEFENKDLGDEKFIFDGTFDKIVNKCWKHEKDEKEKVYCLKLDQMQKLIQDKKTEAFYIENKHQLTLNFEGKTSMKINLNEENMNVLTATENQDKLKLNVIIDGKPAELFYHKPKVPGSKEVWVIVLIFSTIGAICLVLRYYFNCFLPSEAELREQQVKEEKIKNAKMMDKTAKNLTKATEIGIEVMESISEKSLLDDKCLSQNNTEEESESDDDRRKKKKKSKKKKKQTLSHQLKAICENEDIEIADW